MAEPKSSEIEKLITDMAKKGIPPAQIGLELRDKHGIPSIKAATNKKITKILDDSKVQYKKEKDIINSNIDNLKSHIKSNKADFSAVRSLTKKLWAVQRAN